MWFRVLFALCAATLLLGCNPSAPETAQTATRSVADPSDVSKETQSHRRKQSRDGALSLELPQSWEVISANDPGYLARIKTLAEVGTELREHLKPREDNPMFELMAMDLSDASLESGFLPNLNVLPSKLALKDPTREEILEVAQASASDLPGMKFEVFDGPTGPVGHYHGPYQTGDTKTDLFGFVVPANGALYIITISFLRGSGNPELAKQIIHSIEVPRPL